MENKRATRQDTGIRGKKSGASQSHIATYGFTVDGSEHAVRNREQQEVSSWYHAKIIPTDQMLPSGMIPVHADMLTGTEVKHAMMPNTWYLVAQRNTVHTSGRITCLHDIVVSNQPADQISIFNDHGHHRQQDNTASWGTRARCTHKTRREAARLRPAPSQQQQY